MKRENDLELKLSAQFNRDKLFENAPPPELSLSDDIQLPENWQYELCTFDKTGALSQYLSKHIGKDSTYSFKKDLISQLKLVFCRLTGRFDKQLGKLSDDEKSTILSKLTENIELCTQGFHNRVSGIVLSMSRPKTFAQLLQAVRENLVLQVAAKLTNEVHATNTIICLANTSGYGVRARNKDDQYVGALQPSQISHALAQTFERELTPFHLIALIRDAFTNELVLVDAYKGKKADAGYSIGNVEKMLDMIQQFLFTAAEKEEFKKQIDEQKNKPPAEQTNPKEVYYKQYFIVKKNEDDDIEAFYDLNWKNIQTKIFETLKSEGYYQKPQDVKPETILDLILYLEIFPNAEPAQLIGTQIENLIQSDQMDAQFPHLTEFYNKVPESWREKFFKDEKFIEYLEKTSQTPLSQWPACLIQTQSCQTITTAFARLNKLHFPFTEPNNPLTCFTELCDKFVKQLPGIPEATVLHMLNVLIQKIEDDNVDQLMLHLTKELASGWPGKNRPLAHDFISQNLGQLLFLNYDDISQFLLHARI